MANTPNFNLYKPDRADTTVDVDTSLTTNFTTIDTELKNNKDGLDTHKADVNAHASDKITHADGSVKTTLDNHEERIVVAEMDIFNLDSRVDDLEVNGTGGGAIPPDLENRLTTVESDVEGILAPATFDAMNQQSYTFDEYRIGYVNNKLGDVSQILLPGVTTAVEGINELVSQSTDHATQLAEIAINLDSFPIQVPEVDDKARIGRMFDYAKANGKRAVILPKGTYTQSSQLDVTGLSDLLIIAHGATINFTYNTTSTNGSIKAWNISGSSFVTIEGLKINIQNRSLTKQYTAININTSHDIVLRQLNIQNAGWMGITVSDGVEGTSYNIDIDNCKIEYCRFGIWSNGFYVMIRDTYVSNHWSLSTEATSQGAHPVWTATPTDSEWYDGIIIKGQYWSIVNSVIVDNGQSGIYSGGTQHGLIIGCTINNNWNKGVDFGASKTGSVSSIQYVTVEGNTVQDNKTGQIHYSKVDNSKVLGNDSLVLDTTYSDTPAYVQPSIIFNNDCVGNIVQGNVVVQNLATSGIFLNSSGSKSTGNIVKDNKVIATTKYNVNYDDNLVTDQTNGTQQFLSDVQFLRRITSVLNIDLTIGGLTGFDGRNALNLNASSDNTFVQVTANKQIQFNKPDGSSQDVKFGALQTSSATLSGLNFFADTASIRLPRTAQTNEGYIWYDATAKQFKGRTNTADVILA